MRKWLSICMILTILAFFSFGCATISKEDKVKCPKCGAVFTIQEGIDTLKKQP